MSLDPESLLNRRVDRYTFEAFLGNGTVAWVFRASETGTTRPVAIKVLRPRYAGDPQFEPRFRNEFQIASALRHPRIIRLHAVGQVDRLTYLVMDYCPDSLEARIARDGPLPETALCGVALEMADALAFLHDADLIHRDVKPDNILFTDTGHSVLADFGIARVVSGFTAATGANLTIGTPHYLSPEQAQGWPLDARTDLYSLGVTLYKASTGKLPFRSTDWFELARMHVEDPPEAPRSTGIDLSRRMERIILKLMAKRPDDRYQNADALRRDLEDIDATDRPTDTFGRTGESPVLSTEEAHRRWPIRVAAAIVVIIAALLVIVLARR